MRVLVIFVCFAVCASIAMANDRRCDGKEDGALCFCTERMKKGVCKEGECQCTSLTRSKRASRCSSNWDCGSSCSCQNDYCCCPWHTAC